ncbi:hypothetical protein MKX03_003828 [Papaver bracteatum]|nr:hypothetical protein MKX03_003828 [Papaver bracteatum]
MDNMTDSNDSWDFRQEEDEPFCSSYNSHLMTRGIRACGGAEGSTSNQARSNAISLFTGMGFVEALVIEVVDECGEENTDAILEMLLTHKTPEECPQDEPLFSNPRSPVFEPDILDNLSDSEEEEEESHLQTEDPYEMKKKQLLAMGFSEYDVLIATDTCDPDTPIHELMDFISANQIARSASDHPFELPFEGHGPPDAKRKKLTDENEACIKIPRKMIGFGVPSDQRMGFKRRLPDEALPLPYFYYENVARAPKGTWDTISRNLFNIQPEFLDSKHFCVATRKRGYVHNLPTEGRFPLLPIPPLTIQEALPYTSRWWPSWDVRTQLNFLLTRMGSAPETYKVRRYIEGCGRHPSKHIQKQALKICRRWNFVWTGRNNVATLTAEEMEELLGYPSQHTRGGGISQTARYKALGNSFQVNTLAYHFSVLRNRFEGGINVLSLFAGIGGAEIALHQLGIKLNFVVSVEINEANRKIFRKWWENTEQQGILIDDITDVKKLTPEALEELVNMCNGFDLVVGGSPCNNLSGSNRLYRSGLEGAQSILFYDFCDILRTVQHLMRRRAD